MQSPSALTLPANDSRASIRRFARHYAEMVAAMFLGMVLIPPLRLALAPVGVDIQDDPTLRLVAMAVTMTLGMLAWMRYRGHGWGPSADMTAAMVIPTLVVLALLWADLASVDPLIILEHVLMLPSMLVAMLLRREEYTRRH
jgi:hypothetical protein